MMDGLMLYMTCGMFDMGSEYGILEDGGGVCSGASEVLLERLDIPVHLEEESVHRKILANMQFMIRVCLR